MLNLEDATVSTGRFAAPLSCQEKGNYAYKTTMKSNNWVTVWRDWARYRNTQPGAMASGIFFRVAPGHQTKKSSDNGFFFFFSPQLILQESNGQL